jgi:pimeloyl-ACP methyl ester carboxylesterase
MNYQIQGLSIHVEEHGTKEPALVFLHYWGGTSRTWRMVTAELEGQFKTVAYDARGWGRSDKTLAG